MDRGIIAVAPWGRATCHSRPGADGQTSRKPTPPYDTSWPTCDVGLRGLGLVRLQKLE